MWKKNKLLLYLFFLCLLCVALYELFRIHFTPALNMVVKRNYFLVCATCFGFYLALILITKNVSWLIVTISLPVIFFFMLNSFVEGSFYRKYKETYVRQLYPDVFLVFVENEGDLFCKRRYSIVSKKLVIANTIRDIGCDKPELRFENDTTLQIITPIKKIFAAEKITYDTFKLRLNEGSLIRDY